MYLPFLFNWSNQSSRWRIDFHLLEETTTTTRGSTSIGSVQMNNFIFVSIRFSNFHIKRPTSSEAISGTTIIFFFGCEKIKGKLVKTQNLELHICDLTRKIFFEFTFEYLLTPRIEDLVLVLSFKSRNNFKKLNLLFDQQMIHLKVEKQSIRF